MLNKAQAPTPNTEVLPRKDPNFVLRLPLVDFFSVIQTNSLTHLTYIGGYFIYVKHCAGVITYKLKGDLDWLLVV